MTVQEQGHPPELLSVHGCGKASVPHIAAAATGAKGTPQPSRSDNSETRVSAATAILIWSRKAAAKSMIRWTMQLMILNDSLIHCPAIPASAPGESQPAMGSSMSMAACLPFESSRWCFLSDLHHHGIPWHTMAYHGVPVTGWCHFGSTRIFLASEQLPSASRGAPAPPRGNEASKSMAQDHCATDQAGKHLEVS